MTNRPMDPLTPDRRTVVRGLAWSVPVIATAVATPGVSASQCEGTIDWSAYPVGTQINTIPVAGASPATTATFTATYAAQQPQTGRTGRVAAGPQGGVAQNYFVVELRPPRANDSVSIRVVFSRPVSNVEFSLLDIDGASPGYQDSVRVLTPGYTSQAAPRVIGDGTTANPFRQSTPLSGVPSASPDGNLRLNWAGTVSEIEFVYFQPNVATQSANMVIGLGNMTLSTC